MVWWGSQGLLPEGFGYRFRWPLPGDLLFLHSLPRVSWVGLSAVPLFCPLSSSGGPGSPALADEVGWLMGLGRLLVDRCGSLPLCLYMQRV